MNRQARGNEFGRTAEHYDLGRPHYPEEAIDRLVRALELAPTAQVVDLAAGTGRLTQHLATRFARVIAVEPDAEMSALVRDAEVLAGHAEAIPLAAESVDAVFVGEAFHWFARESALAEIARVLAPGGALALLWIVPQHDIPDDAEALWREAVLRGGTPGGPLRDSGVWRAPFEDSPFAPLQEAQVESEEVISRETLISYFLSISSVAAQSEAERLAAADGLRALLPEREYVRRLRTDVYWTRLEAPS